MFSSVPILQRQLPVCVGKWTTPPIACDSHNQKAGCSFRFDMDGSGSVLNTRVGTLRVKILLPPPTHGVLESAVSGIKSEKTSIRRAQRERGLFGFAQHDQVSEQPTGFDRLHLNGRVVLVGSLMKVSPVPDGSDDVPDNVAIKTG